MGWMQSEKDGSPLLHGQLVMCDAVPVVLIPHEQEHSFIQQMTAEMAETSKLTAVISAELWLKHSCSPEDEASYQQIRDDLQRMDRRLIMKQMAYCYFIHHNLTNKQ